MKKEHTILIVLLLVVVGVLYWQSKQMNALANAQPPLTKNGDPNYN